VTWFVPADAVEQVDELARVQQGQVAVVACVSGETTDERWGYSGTCVSRYDAISSAIAARATSDSRNTASTCASSARAASTSVLSSNRPEAGLGGFSSACSTFASDCRAAHTRSRHNRQCAAGARDLDPAGFPCAEFTAWVLDAPAARLTAKRVRRLIVPRLRGGVCPARRSRRRALRSLRRSSFAQPPVRRRVPDP
jgi:hypothetical protein